MRAILIQGDTARSQRRKFRDNRPSFRQGKGGLPRLPDRNSVVGRSLDLVAEKKTRSPIPTKTQSRQMLEIRKQAKRASPELKAEDDERRLKLKKETDKAFADQSASELKRILEAMGGSEQKQISLAEQVSRLGEQPLGTTKKLGAYSSGNSRLLLSVYQNGAKRVPRVNRSVELGSMSSMSTLRGATQSPHALRDSSRTSLRHESTILPQLVQESRRKGGVPVRKAEHPWKWRSPTVYEDIFRREDRIQKKLAQDPGLETSPYLMRGTRVKRTVAPAHYLPSIFAAISQEYKK